MPNRKYEAGRRYEYKIKHEYESLGYEVTRSAASKGLFDLVAILPPCRVKTRTDGVETMLNGELVLIQCKSGKSAKREIAKLDDLNRFEGIYHVRVALL